MDIQHVSVKLIVDNPQAVDTAAIIPLFHSWIQGQSAGELLLDVADYRHVPAGPGVILIGYEANYSMDNSDGRLGVRYSRKTPLAGSNQDRLLEATRAALATCRRFETDPQLNGTIRFNGHDLEITLNDRLLAPNLPESRALADAEFRTFFPRLFAGTAYTATYAEDPRELLSIRVRTAQAFDTEALFANLNSLATVSHTI